MLVLLGVVRAEETPALINGTLSGRVLAGGSGHVFILGPDGKIVWDHKAALVHDAWMLANGNVLYADGSTVTEVTPDQQVVFCYKAAEQKGGGSFSCQRLDNGNTMIGENSTGRVLEVDKAGKIVFELPTTPVTVGQHHNMRMVRKLPGGNYLVCHSGAHIVKEYTPEGKVVLEIKTPELAFAAIRTAANTTLVSTLKDITEYDAHGTVLWKFSNTDLPGVVITNMTGMHLLPNGNIATSCYRIYNNKKEGTAIFEITHDKKLVWRYANPHGDSSIMAVECLDADGKPLAGACQR